MKTHMRVISEGLGQGQAPGEQGRVPLKTAWGLGDVPGLQGHQCPTAADT